MYYYQIPIYLGGLLFVYLGSSMVLDYMIISYQRYRYELTDRKRL
jgi:hypothetical protein